MAVIKRSVKGSELTHAEMDGNWDELIALLARLGVFTASQTPGANNIPVLDASGRLQLSSTRVAELISNGVNFGQRDKTYAMVRAAGGVYLCCNCDYDGTNWRSVTAGQSTLLYINNTGPKTSVATSSTGNQILTWTTSDLLSTTMVWTNATLLNSWANIGAGFAPARYAKDSMGFIHLDGLVGGGTPLSAIFTLPVGYRPAYTIALASIAINEVSYVKINTDGTVQIAEPTGAIAWGTLSGLSFWPG